MKRSFIFYIICNLIAWAVFSLTDYVAETTTNDFEGPIMLILIVVMCITYIIYMFITDKIHASFKWKFMDKLIWFGVGIAFTILISCLVDYNIWIVYQGRTLLNGLEYPFFGMCFVMICLIFFLLFDIGVLLYKRKVR